MSSPTWWNGPEPEALSGWMPSSRCLASSPVDQPGKGRISAGQHLRVPLDAQHPVTVCFDGLHDVLSGATTGRPTNSPDSLTEMSQGLVVERVDVYLRSVESLGY